MIWKDNSTTPKRIPGQLSFLIRGRTALKTLVQPLHPESRENSVQLERITRFVRFLEEKHTLILSNTGEIDVENLKHRVDFMPLPGRMEKQKGKRDLARGSHKVLCPISALVQPSFWKWTSPEVLRNRNSGESHHSRP